MLVIKTNLIEYDRYRFGRQVTSVERDAPRAHETHICKVAP